MKFYTLQESDVGKATIRAFGRVWSVANFIGRILPGDVGKRVFHNATVDIVQVENDEQRAKRAARRRPRTEHKRAMVAATGTLTVGCVTKYHGPTDHRGSRVSAKHLLTGRRVVLPWDDALDVAENHCAAAVKLLQDTWGFEGPSSLLRCSMSSCGYVWVIGRAL